MGFITNTGTYPEAYRIERKREKGDKDRKKEGDAAHNTSHTWRFYR